MSSTSRRDAPRHLALGLSLVVMLGCSFVSAPPVPSPTGLLSPFPTIAQATTRPSAAHPVDNPPPAAFSSPSPTRMASPPPAGGGWITLGSAREIDARWSPDAKHLLLIRNMTNQSSESQQVDLMTPDGELLRTYQGDDAIWVDDQGFLILRYERDCQAPCAGESWTINYGREGDPPTTAFQGSVGVDAVHEIDAPDGGWVASNGRGVVSFSRDEDEDSTFRLWSREGASPPHPGFAASWSTSGDRLLILHPNDRYGPGTYGWVKVFGWPGLEPLYEDQDTDFVWMPAVSPDGELVAYPPAIGESLIRVGDARTATMSDYDIPIGSYGWDDRERLIQVTPRGNAVRIYDRQANLLQTHRRTVGDGMVTSADGSTNVFFQSDEARRPLDRLSVFRDDAWSELQLPAPSALNTAPLVAPDGTAVVVMFVTGGWEESAFVSRL